MKKQIINGLTSLLLPFGAYANISPPAGAYLRSYLRSGAISELPLHSKIIGEDQSQLSQVPIENNDLGILRGQPVRELVIIDAAVPDKHVFHAQAQPGIEFVELTATDNGLEQLENVLSRYHDLNALHIVSHADEGTLLLGNSHITTTSLRDSVNAFAAINGAVRPGGDLLLYGCELGKGNDGGEFLDVIKGNTHVDVAASDNLTGNAQQNGDWELEIHKGDIEARPLPESIATKDFTGILQFTGTIDFSQYKAGTGAYNDSGAYLADAQFYESADKNYLFTVNGADTGTYQWYGYETVASAKEYETSITLEFTNNETFTPNSISLYNANGYALTFYLTTNKGGNISSGSLSDFTWASNIDISGLPDDVTSLTITASEPFFIQIDDLAVSDLQPPDTAPPVVQSIALSGSPAATASSVTYTVAFDESASNISTDDFQVTTVSGTATGTVASVSASSGTSVDVTVNSISGTGTLRLDLTANTDIVDGSGNGNNTNGYVAAFTSGDTHTVDRDAPTVSSINRVTGALTNAISVDYTATFNENVTGVDTTDFTLTSTGTAAGTIATIAPVDSSTYTLTVNGISGDGTLRLDLNGSGTGITDAVGNAISGGFTGQAYTIDNTAPAAPSAPDLTASSDRGTSDTDDLTSDTTPTFTGTAEAGATVLLYANGTEVGSATADGSGNWSITSDTLGEGMYFITARAQDAAGNLSAASSSLSVTIDATGPVVSAPDMTAASDSGSSNTDNITNVSKPEFTGTAPAGTLIQLFIDNAGNGDATDPLNEIIATGTADGDGTWSITATVDLSAGTWSIKARGQDGAGNFGAASSSVDVTVDITPPAAVPSVPDLATGSDTGSSSTDNVTSDTTPTFSGTHTANNVVRLYANGVLVGSATVNGDSDWTITSDALGADTYSFTARGVDLAGNEGTASTGLSVTIDNAAPTAPSTPDMDADSDTGNSDSDNNTEDTTPTFSGTGAEANATVYLYVGGVEVGSSTADGSGNWSVTVSAGMALDAGDYFVVVRTEDAAGNLSNASGALPIHINTAPTANGNLSQTVNYMEDPGGSVALDDIVVTDVDPGDTITATLTLSDAAAGVLSTGTYGSATSTFDGDTGVWTVTGSVADVNAALAAVAFTPATDWDQNVTITTRIRDINGSGPTDGTITLNVTAVNDAPSDIALSAASINQSSTGANVAIGALNSTDMDGGDTHTYALVANGTSDSGSCGATGDDDNSSFQIDSTNQELETIGSLPAGSYSVCIETDDGAPASYQKTFTITVVDDVAPTISSVSVPADAIYIAGQNLDFTVNTDENVTVSGTPRIALTVGAATTRYADYISDSGTSALLFRYTVQAGDNDADGIVVDALGPNGGTLQDSAGNNLNITLNSVDDTTGVLVDTQAPTLDSSTPTDNASGIAFDADIELNFSENVIAGAGSVSVYDAADDSLVESFASSTLGIVADVVTINLTSNLTPTHNYYVQVDSDAFEDTAGNAYAGIADETTLNFTVGNNAPVAGDDNDTTDEDTAVAVDVLANDTDSDSAFNAASTAIVTPPANGSTSVNTATGVITYTPDDDFNGIDSFTYTVEDVHGTISNTATVSITITAVNDAPVAVNDLESTPEDTNASFDVAANDTDLDTGDSVDTTTITIVTPPTNGSATVNAGQVDYDPDADFNGTDTFTYTIEDQNGALSNVATVTINVTGVNDLPTAANDSDSVDEDDSVDIDVLDNDSDIDGTLDSTTVTVMANPANGSTSVDALTGVITYTPSANYNGSDSFTYVVQDDAGGTSNAATVTLTVNSVNDAPVAANDTAVMLEDTAHEVNVLGNDSDVDGTLVPASVEVVTGPAEGGISINATTGAITYTPDSDFSGSDVFTYRVQDNDGAWSSAATVTMTVDNVNDPPVANGDSATLDEDASVVINMLANDTDVDDTLDTTSVVVVSAPTNGSADVNPDGSVTYTPEANFNGIDSFTYEVNDAVGDTSNPATVSITIDPVNDAPVISGTPATTVAQDGAYVFSPSSSDVENDALTFSVTNLPAWASFDTASGAVSGTPGNGDVGTSGSIVISVDDGTDSSNLAAFTITVTNVNDAPTISGSPAIAVLQDMPYSFTPTADDVDTGDTLTFSIANQPAWASFNTATGALTGLPNNSAVGFTGNIVISVSDGTVSTALPAFNITVMNVNDAPLTGEDSYNLSEGGLLQVDAIEGILANDVDIDGDTLTVTVVDAPASASAFTLNTDGSFSYQHDGTESRNDSFSYELSDGTVTTEPVLVNLAIAAVNDAPEFVTTPETTTVMRGTDFFYDIGVNDPDSVVQLTLLEAPEWLTLSNSILQGTAPADATSPASVQLRASDGEFTVDQSFDLTLADPEDSVVTLSTNWHKLPARVGDPLRLDITLAQTSGPALSDATLRVRLRGESSGATMEECNAVASDLFECPTSLTVETSDEFHLGLTPVTEGNLAVELRLLDSDGNTVAEGITDVSVSEKPVGQPNLIYILAHATALASIELIDDENHELVVGTSLGDTIKLLDYDMASLTADEIGEIGNEGETESVRIADVNLDGLPDVLVVNSEGDASQLYYNMGGLVFEEDMADSELPYAKEAIFIDLNDDDYPELIMGANGFNIYVYENNNGYFDSEPYVMNLPIAVRHFAMFKRLAGADPFTGKLAIAGSHSVRLLSFDLLDTSVANNKPGAVVQQTPLRKTTQLSQLAIPGVTSILLADLDGDNQAEILLSSDHSDNSADNSGVKIVSVSSTDNMTEVAAFSNAGARQVSLANFNGDSAVDLLVANNNQTYQFYLGTGSLTSWTLKDTVIYQESTLVLTEDLNGDGLSDVLIYKDAESEIEFYTSEANGEIGVATDLGLSSSAAALGERDYRFNYSLTVNNQGGGDAQAVRASVALPDNITVSALPDNCSEDNGEVTCSLQTVNAGDSTSVTLVLLGDTSINSQSLTAQVTSDALEQNSTDNRYTLSLSGMFEGTSIRVSGGSGGFGPTGLILLGLLALMRNRRLRRSILPVLACLFFTPTGHAQTITDRLLENSYLELDLGRVSGDWNENAFNNRLAEVTPNGEVSNIDDERAGWQLLLGYRLTELVALEAGYLDWGDTDLKVEAFTSDPSGVLQLLRDHYPASGDGWYIGSRIGYQNSRDMEFYVKGGVWGWQADYTITASGYREKVSDDGIDFPLGAGFAIPVSGGLSLGGQVQQVSLNGESQTWLGLSVQFDFK